MTEGNKRRMKTIASPIDPIDCCNHGVTCQLFFVKCKNCNNTCSRLEPSGTDFSTYLKDTGWTIQLQDGFNRWVCKSCPDNQMIARRAEIMKELSKINAQMKKKKRRKAVKRK